MKPRDIPCPTCAAEIGAACVPVYRASYAMPCPTCGAGIRAWCVGGQDAPCAERHGPGGDIDPGMTHRTRAEEASRLTPRPPAPDRERVERLYREREQAWAALDAASRGEG